MLKVWQYTWYSLSSKIWKHAKDDDGFKTSSMKLDSIKTKWKMKLQNKSIEVKWTMTATATNQALPVVLLECYPFPQMAHLAICTCPVEE